MNISLILQGIIYGFTIGMIVGPIGILCMRTTLAQGFIAGICAGLGAATADAVYGAIAGLGFSTVSCFLIDYQIWLHLFGGLFLLYLGIKTFQTPVTKATFEVKHSGLANLYAITFLLTLTNPTTILAFIALFSGLDIGGSCTGFANPMIFVLGVFLGSMIWWIMLCTTISYIRHSFSGKQLRLLNIVSGLLIFGFGLWSIAKIFMH